MWLPEKGAVKQEYTGTVIDEVVRAGRPKLYKVKYDDYDEAQFHYFSHTKREWRVISSPESKGEASQSESQPKAPTRSAGRPSDARQRVHTRSQVATVAAKPLDATTSTIEVNKATQNIIDVVTELGVAQYRVPANKREVAESPQREDWLQADKKALEAILKAGNTLVPISKPADLDVPIARTVTARRIKIDPATGKLAEHNPFKSRHNVDGGYLKIQQEQHNDAASPDDRDVPATSTVVDDLTLKMFLAHAAKHDLDFVKGDVGNAYAKGKSIRQVGYMHLPSTLPMLDEDGTPLCIELHTPMWGEREAGYEWQCTLTDTILKMGWNKCEGVPAMYTFPQAKTELPAAMITVVDDFLIAGKGTEIG